MGSADVIQLKLSGYDAPLGEIACGLGEVIDVQKFAPRRTAEIGRAHV